MMPTDPSHKTWEEILADPGYSEMVKQMISRDLAVNSPCPIAPDGKHRLIVTYPPRAYCGLCGRTGIFSEVENRMVYWD